MAQNQVVTPYRNLDLDETGVIVDATPCKVAVVSLCNLHATAVRYVKFYNKATAATNADTPILTIPVAPSILGGSIDVNLLHREWPFNTGLSMRCTTGIADNDTGAPGNNEMVVNLGIIENYNYTL